ncbi:SGNH/GDSL hydrolase family protein [Myroides odoratimimus]|uniref:SGNH/GDSL hydrolase family protein n=1 Tax=Myroides odoratimimus TaxID=76832 RepID=UPI00257499BE|nr:SGNH/GDSL hydrolase family protein [Myroides odoratimimus]MDM1513605.1 SGNH/GDSL hydrolase family protein [Myroides odoratimimus]
MKKIKYFCFLLIIFCFVSCNINNDWISIGDSITWQDGKKFSTGVDKGVKAIGYQSLINDKFNLTNKNLGFSGLPLTGETNSVFSNCKDESFQSQLITIFVGTNDFKLNKPIGNSIVNKDVNTFIGALNSLIDLIQLKNPKTKIVLITPLQRDNDHYDIYKVNNANHKLIDYVNSIIEIGNNRNLLVIDLYHNSDIQIDNLHLYTLDGLHPNNKGYELISESLQLNIDFKSITH